LCSDQYQTLQERRAKPITCFDEERIQLLTSDRLEIYFGVHKEHSTMLKPTATVDYSLLAVIGHPLPKFLVRKKV
jgi:hypothetical protein